MYEIGGYIEFEHFHGAMLHEDGIKLDSGRSCLGYLIKAKGIRKIAIPSFMCDSVFHCCESYGVQLHFYQVGLDFLPEEVEIHDDEYLYLMNYYGQLDKQTIEFYRDRYHRVIVDNTQAYFDEPIVRLDTFYTCRKFFGVPDGGILYTDTFFNEELPQSESRQHFEHLLGRLECTGTEFYPQSVANNERLADQPILKMSKLTENLLHGIDYDYVRKTRSENFRYLSKRLSGMNQLKLSDTEGAFAYPLMIEGAAVLRKVLISENIYVPILWPGLNDSAGLFAENILPLPCDQRYGETEMDLIVHRIEQFMISN